MPEYPNQLIRDTSQAMDYLANNTRNHPRHGSTQTWVAPKTRSPIISWIICKGPMAVSTTRKASRIWTQGIQVRLRVCLKKRRCTRSQTGLGIIQVATNPEIIQKITQQTNLKTNSKNHKISYCTTKVNPTHLVNLIYTNSTKYLTYLAIRTISKI